MRNRKLIGIVYVVIFLSLNACKTTPAPDPPPPPPPPPRIETQIALTPAILLRLNNNNGSYEGLKENAGKYQLAVFGRISLEYEYTDRTQRVEQGGRVRFDDVYTRDVLTVVDQLEGQAIDFTETDDEVILSVCFERDRGENVLNFSSKKADTGGYFYLKMDRDASTPLSGEEKGTIEYEGKKYKVKYTGEEAPYLLIRMTVNSSDKSNTRRLEGRKVP
jgi:hypothetical protein